jgi:hypothetical protein
VNPKEKILISFIILGARPTSTLGPKRNQLVEHWRTEKVRAEAEKMKNARAAVKNPSHVGRGGRK